MVFDLTGKVALVTGASRGLGAAAARRLAAHGAAVAVNYVASHDLAQSVVDAINSSGGRAKKYCCDITKKELVDAMVKEIVSDLGPVDVVVNNATGPQPFVRIEDQTWEDHLGQLRFFIMAPLYILQAVVPSMKERRRGRVINIGSECAELGNAEFGHYCAAKAAMLGLTRSWANELGPYDICVNLIAPGWIPVERHGDVPQEASNAYTAGMALNRQGVPDDIGNAVVYLASDEANLITGQKLAVNGGNTFV